MFRLTNNQISKAILILRAITTHGRPATLKDLALLTNTPKSSIQRYTDLLERISVLDRTSCGSCGCDRGLVHGDKADKYLRYWGVTDAPENS